MVYYEGFSDMEYRLLEFRAETIEDGRNWSKIIRITRLDNSNFRREKSKSIGNSK